MKTLSIALAGAALVLALGAAWAQAPAPTPDRDKSPPRSLCDALAGVERDRCIAQEKSQREALRAPDNHNRRFCDELFGPEKELCLKQGGRIRAGTDASSAAGGTAPR